MLSDFSPCLPSFSCSVFAELLALILFFFLVADYEKKLLDSAKVCRSHIQLDFYVFVRILFIDGSMTFSLVLQRGAAGVFGMLHAVNSTGYCLTLVRFYTAACLHLQIYIFIVASIRYSQDAI